jgi:uncharacterized protein DUF4386
MTVELAAGIALIVVPLAFNAAFLELGRAFNYPNILREPPDLILRRFAAGGPSLLLRWQALLFSALLMLPMVALLAVALAAPPALAMLALVIGTAAGLVQAIGLTRWPFAVPELARRYVAAEGEDAAATRRTIEEIFASLHRLLGVGIGEHLGYLLTGAWTVVVAISALSGATVAPWLGWIGIPIGVALVIGSAEFVGSNEARGWPLAARIVPIAYVAWSLWLIGLGIGLLV